MKLHGSIPANSPTPRRSLWRTLFSVVPAFLLAHTALAQTNDYYVTWDANDATDEIQNAINNAVVPARIILSYHSTPWYVSQPIVLYRNNMTLRIMGGGKVMAKAGGHTGDSDDLFVIKGSNVMINGYVNGVDAADGVATFEMRKADYADPQGGYTPSESRHGISIAKGDNITIKGLNIVRSGGDGICINKWKDPNNSSNIIVPYNVLIKDVTCDDNYRQGLSVICVDTLTVRNCTFKNTNGTAPEAGVDLEPSIASDVLKDINFIDCTFANNSGNNVEMNFHALNNTSTTPVDISFDGCLINGGPKNGISFYGIEPSDATTGSIVFQNITIQNMTQSGIRFGNWSADHVSVTFSNVYVMECNPGATVPPIFFVHNDDNIVHGDVDFTGDCHIHESFDRSNAMVGASIDVRAGGLKDITGAITVHRPATSNGALRNFGSNITNCTLTVTEIP